MRLALDPEKWRFPMRKTMIAAVVALAAGAVGYALPSSAATVSLGSKLPILDEQVSSNIELVQSRKFKRRWVYNSRRHGLRHRYRHGRYRYHYGGWWYPRRWWAGPTIALGIAPLAGAYGSTYGDAHVQWCLNRYRSYDPSTDTFMGYDGYRHRCNSPY
jgi:hypothetical protein